MALRRSEGFEGFAECEAWVEIVFAPELLLFDLCQKLLQRHLRQGKKLANVLVPFAPGLQLLHVDSNVGSGSDSA